MISETRHLLEFSPVHVQVNTCMDLPWARDTDSIVPVAAFLEALLALEMTFGESAFVGRQSVIAVQVFAMIPMPGDPL